MTPTDAHWVRLVVALGTQNVVILQPGATQSRLRRALDGHHSGAV
ncbi:hypothetical protein [Halorubellus salinus]|nr:hypothetical protein [Halorubellus salinus]